MRLLLLATLPLVLAPLLPLAGASPEGGVAFDDPAGDVVLDAWWDGLPPTAVPVLVDALDLLGVALGNVDDEGFDVVVAVADLDPANDPLLRHFSDAAYSVAFDLTGSPFTYRLDVTYEPLGDVDWDFENSPVPAATPMAYAMLGASDAAEAGDGEHEDEGMHGGEYVAHLPAVLDFDANTITVRVPLAALQRAGPGDLLLAPLEGDALTNLRASSGSYWPAPVADRAPDEGVAPVELVFAQSAANGLVRLGWPVLEEEHKEMGDHEEHEDDDDGGDEPTPEPAAFVLEHVMPFAVNPGAPTLIQVALENRGLEPQVVRLSAAVESEAPGFTALVPDEVALDAGQTAWITVVATLTGPVEHRSLAEAVVEGVTPAGDVARIRVPLVASQGPTAEFPTLRLHTAAMDAGNPLLALHETFYEHRAAWLNALEVDPLADDADLRIDGVLNGGIRNGDGVRIVVFGNAHGGAGMDTPLARPLTLLEHEPILLTVGLRSSASEEGLLKAALFQGDQLVAEAEVPASLASGQDTPIALELLPQAATLGFEEDREHLGLHLMWQAAPLVDGPVTLSAAGPRELHLVTKLTQVTLPIDAAAEQHVGPLVAFPEPPAEPLELDSSNAASRNVPGPALGVLALAGAGAALAARRRRA